MHTSRKVQFRLTTEELYYDVAIYSNIWVTWVPLSPYLKVCGETVLPKTREGNICAFISLVSSRHWLNSSP